ncbi:MAG TPA: serine/threonine-protein kinase [Polyangiaceae bacterium]
MAAPGDLIGGKYRLIRTIGDGGMGVVYEARHEALGSPVAVKFLKAELAQTPGLAARFLREARVAANIASPHVAHVSDVDTAADGSPYLVMELLSGEPLQRLLDKQSKLGVAQAIDFALQILSGLEAAHAVSVVHRDLKPDNVFVTPGPNGPFLKLLDFGIAKVLEPSEAQKGLTRSGVVMGTAEYMPPEQLYAASDVDPRADLYALGVMLFEMLSGKRPAEGGDAEVIVGKVLSGQVFALETLEPNLPAGLVGVVRRAIAPDREARFRSAKELRQALEPFAHPAQPERTSDVPKTLPPATAADVERVYDSPSRGSTEPAAAPIVGGAWTPPHAPTGKLPARRKRRPVGLLLALLLTAVAGAGVAAVLLLPHEDTERDPTPPPIPAPEPSEAVIAPLDQAPQQPVPQPPVGPNTPIPGPGPRPPADAGPATQSDAGTPTIPTVPPFKLPSTFPPLPPIPSTFPALPSTFPPLPSTFPGIPGLGPPAPTNPPPRDGG